jgi:two-component system LytT family response regulator
MIRTILIDNEKDSLSALRIVLEEYCPEIEIVAVCQSAPDGVTSIIKNKPELIFLDIEMPLMNGFELLEKVKDQQLSVIFTTAFHHYAIIAIRYSAIDYLVKPIDPHELVLAVNRYIQGRKIHTTSNLDQFQFLIDTLSQKAHTYKKLAIPNLEGFKLVHVDDILYCEADDNYTYIYIKNPNGKNPIKIIASRILKDIQHLLSEYDMFVRIHHSYLVNLNEVNQYVRGEGGHVVMHDGTVLAVSRNKKEALMKYIGK